MDKAQRQAGIVAGQVRPADNVVEVKSKLEGRTMDKFVTLFASEVPSKQAAKLGALAQMGCHDVHIMAGVLLSAAINDAWEGYRKNPKHAAEVAQWEAERL